MFTLHGFRHQSVLVGLVHTSRVYSGSRRAEIVVPSRSVMPSPLGVAVPVNWSRLTGDRNLVRIGTRAAEEGTCPDKLAAKALPAVYPLQRSRQRKKFLADFPLDAVIGVLDDVEAYGLTRQEAITRLGRGARPPLHPGLVRWAASAASGYLDAIARLDTPATVL